MIHNVFNKVINKITLNINFKNNSMNKLFSKINDLQFSYHLYQAIERNEKIRIVNNGIDYIFNF